MKIRCLAIDDEPIALEKLANYINKLPYLELIAKCTSPLDAVKILSDTSIDVIFTDISLPDISGTELVSSLRRSPWVVFVTAHPEYAIESYKIGALDYILKPYSFSDFQRAADRVRVNYEKYMLKSSYSDIEADSIFVKVDYKWVKLNTKSIRYIQAYGDYLRLFIIDVPSPYLIHSSMTQIYKKLPSYFMQVHRSYIVNSLYISEVNKSGILLGDGIIVPIGNSYKENLNNFLTSHSVLDKN